VEALQKIPQVREVAGEGENRYLVVAANDLDVRPQLARLVVERGWELLELKAQEFTLEEVFLDLVTEEEVTEEES
ncbi:MAG: ABC transporter ATP-binding protein, partial [Syntrophales bacterium]|nr:ABC transporter ATP-binding protein [Syntrophales bacterium]